MIRLFLDEDVPEAIAIALRLRGYNVLNMSLFCDKVKLEWRDDGKDFS